MISRNKKIIKDIIFFSLIVMVIILVGYFILWKMYLRNLFNYLQYGKQEKDLISYIKINDIIVPYDSNTNTYYFPISESRQGEEEELEIQVFSNKYVNYIVDGQKFEDSITIKTILDYDNEIELYSNSIFYYNNYIIKFTNLPILNINIDAGSVNEDYVYSNIQLIDPSYEENESLYSLTSDIKIRTRGDSSSIYPKKSYRIKLMQNNSPQNMSLLGMRDDSDWILDSLYSDNSKIRTYLSYDLWNIVNEDLKDEEYPTLNCKYVEVFMNNEYIGLYLLKEPIDEKSLNLNQTTNIDSGVLLKGINHDYIDFSEENISSIKDEFYCSLEIKYPSDLKDYSKYWYGILPKMRDYYTGNINDEIIEQTFYKENLANYRIYLTALSAKDNYEPKNVYFSVKSLDEDEKVILTPWDLDLTFGLTWLGEAYEEINEIESLYYLSESPEFLNYLKERWNYLKKVAFNEEVVYKLIDSYYTEITTFGAVYRDYEKWISSDMDIEIERIKSWCKERFEIVDDYITNL